MNPKVILIHGNGGGKPTDNWLPYVKLELEKWGIEAIAPQFPDADLARASYDTQGHFGGDYNKTTFPELVAEIKNKLL
jgi:hypothetical protein